MKKYGRLNQISKKIINMLTELKSFAIVTVTIIVFNRKEAENDAEIQPSTGSHQRFPDDKE